MRTWRRLVGTILSVGILCLCQVSHASLKYGRQANQNLNTTDSPTFANLTLTNPLAVSYGGTGSVTSQAAVDTLIGTSTLGYVLQYDGSHWVPAAISSGLWTNSSSLDYLTTTSHAVSIGSSSQIDSAKFGVLGTSDILTSVIKGASGQTDNLTEWQINDGTVKAYVDIAGGIHSSGTGGGVLTLGGSSSGTTSVQPAAVASGTLTLPATTGTLSVIPTNVTVSVSSNAGTVAVTTSGATGHYTFTNSSAANMTITMATSGASDMQTTIVRIYDFSAVAKTITWVNTENSTVSAPTTSNGSTTLPLTVVFHYNSATSKWRCVGSA